MIAPDGPAHGEPEAGLTRRQALKRAAVAGGALVWATPVVQAVAMDAAHADRPSEGSGGPEPTPTSSPSTKPPTDVLGDKYGPGSGGGKLPYTGGPLAVLGALGAGAVAAGAALGATARRRGTRPAPTGKHSPDA